MYGFSPVLSWPGRLQRCHRWTPECPCVRFCVRNTAYLSGFENEKVPHMRVHACVLLKYVDINYLSSLPARVFLPSVGMSSCVATLNLTKHTTSPCGQALTHIHTQRHTQALEGVFAEFHTVSIRCMCNFRPWVLPPCETAM